MPRLVKPENVGRISNIAWGLGYLGGMIVLIFVVLFMAGNEETGKTLLGLTPIFGLDPAQGEGARATGPLAAMWYLVFLLPMFLFTPDYHRPTSVGSAVSTGLRELAGSKLTNDGEIIFDAQRHRTQERNKQDAVERFLALLRKAAERKKYRVKTRPSLSAKRKRVDSKKKRGDTKKMRQKPSY